MDVAVLYPQDCLRDGISHHRRLISPPRSKARRSTVAHNPSPAQNRSGRRKQRSPSGSPPPPQSKPNDDAKAFRAKSPGLTGQIRILKRGEDLSPTKKSTAVTAPVKKSTAFTAPVKIQKMKREGSVERANSDPVALSTRRKSPERGPAPKPNLFAAGFYAGSASMTSPPPSSLPLPGFCTKGFVSSDAVRCSTKSTAEDVVALDLRRILRIA